MTSSAFDHELARHRIPSATFDQLCTGAVDTETMVLLEKSQYSQRKLALRALIDQLETNPDVVGPHVEPEAAWRLLAAAERRDPEAVEDILLYPSVGVWLTRALHFTRRTRSGPGAWPELGYLHLVAAAAAIRCGIPCVMRVPVWHGVVTLPTVGQLRMPTVFPIGVAEVHCSTDGAWLQANDGRISINLAPETATSMFSPAKRYVSASRGLVLSLWVDDVDPYRGFTDPMPPGELEQPDLAELYKLLDEAWDVLTLRCRGHARELAVGARMLVPIPRDLGVAGASSPAAFGGIAASATDSAIDLAETLVHELQHSKLNALFGLVETVRETTDARFCAPWRDDPRPLTALLHGVYAFVCAVEFWLSQRDHLREAETRRAEFTFAYRCRQIRQAVDVLQSTDQLTSPGRRLVEILAARLVRCEQAPVLADLADIAVAMTSDHSALWRLWFVRPDPVVVEHIAAAWPDRAPILQWFSTQYSMLADRGRPLPAHRRNLLHTKAIAPEAFIGLTRRPAMLPGSTPLADAALCKGDHEEAATGYRNRINNEPDDLQAWVGLGLAMRATCKTAAARALLDKPEVTVAAHRRIRTLGGSAEPVAFANWLGSGL